MKKTIITFFTLILTVSLSAQNKKWTLEECVEYALKNNISIKQSELDVEIADIAKRDAFGNYLPSLNASASNAWNTGLTQNVTTGILQTQTTRTLPIVSRPALIYSTGSVICVPANAPTLRSWLPNTISRR